MTHTLFLLGAPQGGEGGGSSMFSLLLILGVFFVFMILPQIRRNREGKKFRASIGKGDKVVLNSGIHGKIIEDNEDHFILQTEGDGKLKIEKAAVSMENTRAVYPKDKA